MAQSPVEFAVAFEKLRSRIATSAGSDDAILSLIEFWPRLEQLGKNSAYSSYIAEYLAFLEASLRDGGTGDLSIDELKQLEMICLSIGVGEELVTNIRKQIARLCFYVGELQEGLQTCLRITNESLTLNSDLGLWAILSEIERFRILVDHVGEAAPNTRNILLRLLNDWQSEREFVSTGSIHSLLVQHSSVGDRPRGKLRILTGSIEERGSHGANDEITFDNQLKAADDPIVGVTYQALAAIRSYFKATGYPKLGSQHYHAHLALAEREATYTGDSIGIATALLAYAQLLHTQALRHDHLLPGDIACTGGIDESGRVTPVNSDSLFAKVERVFFSHTKYLVLPSANLAQAQQHRDALLAKYPARQLILLPAASLSGIVNDHNIVRPDKLCIGEFVAKNAVKYSRMTKVQVPLLMVLAYLLLCVIYPKAWVGFDRNPYELVVKNNQIVVTNATGDFLWLYAFPDHIQSATDNWTICDINGDGRREVLIVPYEFGHNGTNGRLFVFTDSGDTLFTRDCLVRGVYPTDVGSRGDSISTEGACVYVRQYRGKAVIISCVAAMNPGRGYIRFWGANGEAMGRYIHSGYAFCDFFEDIDGDGIEEALFKGTNNRLGCASFFGLDPVEADGVSPPYVLAPMENDSLDLRFVRHGIQKFYIFFPPSELIQYVGTQKYQSEYLFRRMADGTLQLELNEGPRNDPLSLVYIFDNKFRVKEVSATDTFEFAYLKAKADGKCLPPSIGEFEDMIRDRVTYLIDGKLVTEAELRTDPLHHN